MANKTNHEASPGKGGKSVGMTENRLLRIIELQGQMLDIMFGLLTRSEADRLGVANMFLAKLTVLRSELVTHLEAIHMTLDSLESSVTKTVTVEASAVKLIDGMSQLIKDAGTDPVKLKALTDNLDASRDALAAAVTANTPPPPPPPPTV